MWRTSGWQEGRRRPMRTTRRQSWMAEQTGLWRRMQARRCDEAFRRSARATQPDQDDTKNTKITVQQSADEVSRNDYASEHKASAEVGVPRPGGADFCFLSAAAARGRPARRGLFEQQHTPHAHVSSRVRSAPPPRCRLALPFDRVISAPFSFQSVSSTRSLPADRATFDAHGVVAFRQHEPTVSASAARWRETALVCLETYSALAHSAPGGFGLKKEGGFRYVFLRQC
jgi:hypothetical protein